MPDELPLEAGEDEDEEEPDDSEDDEQEDAADGEALPGGEDPDKSVTACSPRNKVPVSCRR